jgi:aspartate/methionine/tyrosine aminotransferase
VEYPADVLDAFRDLARARGLALIVDETYRDFDSRHSFEMGGRPHDLMTDPDWSDTVIQLYSFSKAYRLTGHRVGAIIASAERLFRDREIPGHRRHLPQPIGPDCSALGHAEPAAMASGRA